MTTEIHDNALAVFQRPDEEVGTQKKEWISLRPINQLTEGASIEFNVPGTSMTYIDLKDVFLRIKLKLVKADGTDMKTTDNVGLINNPLHSIFSQVDVNVQQHPTSEIGTNYPFKAYLDQLFDTTNQHELDCSLFKKDSSGTHMSDTDPAGANNGLYLRSFYTNGSKEVELMGRLRVDLCQQERLILNGVPINIKLWQSSDAFRIVAKNDATDKYKVNIIDASLKVAYVKVDPSVIIGHADTLKTTEALYPYKRSVIKNYAVPKGQYSFITDDLFQGEVPQQLIVGLVQSVSVHGSYFKNPFNFENFDCNYAGFFVDGQSTPFEPLQPNYKGNQFLDAYHRLYWDLEERAVHVSREDFKNGYCLYVFRPSGYGEDRATERAHTRLELKFSEALPDTCTVIVYAKFPALMKINASRNVTLE